MRSKKEYIEMGYVPITEYDSARHDIIAGGLPVECADNGRTGSSCVNNCSTCPLNMVLLKEKES